MNELTKRFLPSFARTRTRGLRDAQRDLLEHELPKHQLHAEHDHADLLTKYDNAFFEIGYGGGEHLCHRAGQSPDDLYIGCEVYDEGIVKCLTHIQNDKLTNVKLFTEDARLLIEALPDHSLTGVYILFPDPWPKTKHHKRRIVNQELIGLLHQKIHESGFIQVGTDHPEYINWVMVQFANSDLFGSDIKSMHDWQTEPIGHKKTRYQIKNRSGSEQNFYVRFEKVS